MFNSPLNGPTCRYCNQRVRMVTDRESIPHYYTVPSPPAANDEGWHFVVSHNSYFAKDGLCWYHYNNPE